MALRNSLRHCTFTLMWAAATLAVACSSSPDGADPAPGDGPSEDAAPDGAGGSSVDGAVDGSPVDGSPVDGGAETEPPDSGLEEADVEDGGADADGGQCPPLTCTRTCAGGLEQDDQGCEICECRYDVVLTTVEDVTTHAYGTFSSHNQRVVETAGGIFLTYQVNENGGDGNGDWKLARSQDAGLTWQPVFTASGTRPPAVVADNAGNVHLVTSDPSADTLHLYSFSASSGYGMSSHRHYDGVRCDAKFTALYDPSWNNVYVGTQYGRFLAIWLDTLGVIHDYQVFQDLDNTSPYACAQYPQLALDADKSIHFAMTTSNLADTHVYRNILHVYASPNSDGTLSWRRMPRPGETQPSYTPLPIRPDENGDAYEINDYDERGSPQAVSVHLTNFIAKGGRLHFYYTVVRDGNPTWGAHYKRFNRFTGSLEVNVDDDVTPIGGDVLVLAPNGGFFSTDNISDESSPLYLTSAELARGQVATLVSYDNGTTWHDHAVTDVASFQKSNISGARYSDGRILAACNAVSGNPAYPASILYLGFYPR